MTLFIMWLQKKPCFHLRDFSLVVFSKKNHVWKVSSTLSSRFWLCHVIRNSNKQEENSNNRVTFSHQERAFWLKYYFRRTWWKGTDKSKAEFKLALTHASICCFLFRSVLRAQESVCLAHDCDPWSLSSTRTYWNLNLFPEVSLFCIHEKLSALSSASFEVCLSHCCVNWSKWIH